MLRDLKRALVATGMILALGSFALGQDQNSRGSYGSQRGYQQGYNDGFQHGREDRNRRADRNYESDNYRRGDRGYDSNSGDRSRFAAAYRQGYQAGYDDGYNGRNARPNDAYGRGGYGRDNRNRRGGYGSNNVAYDNGYRDGIDGARSDMRENKRFDYNDHGWYQDADHGYSSRYGSRELYQQQYRQGYEAGYRETFGQQGPGYGSGRYGNDRRGNSDAAYSNGYQDGIVGAREDMHGRNSSDPTRHGWWKEANRGYDGRYGSPQDYKQRYRQGYEAGYNNTYRKRW